MIEVSVKSELDSVIKKLTKIEKEQVPFATAVAQTSVAQMIKQAEYEEMQKVFDRPTRFTLNSLWMKRATKKAQKASVGLRDWAMKGNAANTYLGPQIYPLAAQRRLKGFERLLNAKGVLPDGYYAVPAKRARLDNYGNISKGLLNQILSYSGAQRDHHQNTKQGQRRQTRARFIILDETSQRAGGLWAVTPDQRIYPVLIFVKKMKHDQLLDFYGVAERVYEQNMVKKFEAALKYALQTAK